MLVIPMVRDEFFFHFIIFKKNWGKKYFAIINLSIYFFLVDISFQSITLCQWLWVYKRF